MFRSRDGQWLAGRCEKESAIRVIGIAMCEVIGNFECAPEQRHRLCCPEKTHACFLVEHLRPVHEREGVSPSNRRTAVCAVRAFERRRRLFIRCDRIVECAAVPLNSREQDQGTPQLLLQIRERSGDVRTPDQSAARPRRIAL